MFKRYPIGYFHIDIAEVRTAEGKLHLFVVVDRCTPKFAFVELNPQATTGSQATSCDGSSRPSRVSAAE